MELTPIPRSNEDQIHEAGKDSKSVIVSISGYKWMKVAWHTVISETYLYAIVWQFSNLPLQYNIGYKLKFLTFQCTCIQFVSYRLCLIADFVPALKKPRDFIFASLSYPLSMVVFTVFWIVYSYDRELISPLRDEVSGLFPIWLNHISHTLILPANLIELLLVNHEYPEDKKALLALTTYACSYAAVILSHRYVSGRFVYGFIDKMNPPIVVGFIVATMGFASGCYYVGKSLSSYFNLKRPKWFGIDKKKVDKSNDLLLKKCTV